MQPYFMAYCVESLLKIQLEMRDLNPGPSKYQYNTLPTELSWLVIELSKRVIDLALSKKIVLLLWTDLANPLA